MILKIHDYSKLMIALDVDGPCAMQTDTWLQYYNEAYNDDLQFNEVTEWNIANLVKPECGSKIYDFLQEPEFYARTKPVPGYQEGVKELRSLGYEITYVTSCPLGTADQKFEWVLRHDPDATWHDVIVAYNKHRITGDVLIDDGPHNLSDSLMKTVRFAMPWNKGSAAHAHAHGWEDMPILIEQALHAPHKYTEARWIKVA